MPTLLTPIVGTFARKLATIVLANLSAGTSLLLDPDPTNEWDPNAIKVSVDLTAVRMTDQQIANCNKESIGYLIPNPLHLGFIAREGRKTCNIGLDTYPGNSSVLSIISGTPDWTAVLAFHPTGSPLVQLEY